MKVRKEVSTKQKNIAVVKRTIGGIFSGKLFKAGTLVDKQLQQKLIKFLKQAKDGIVDWGQILKRGKGGKANVDDFVPTEFKEKLPWQTCDCPIGRVISMAFGLHACATSAGCTQREAFGFAKTCVRLGRVHAVRGRHGLRLLFP